MKVGEWLLQLVGDDPVDVEVEPFEERPVEVASDLIGAGSVQIPRIGQEVEPSFEDLHPNSEFSVRRGETGFDSRPIGVNLPQAIFDLGLWQRAVGGQVEQSLFLGVEVFELLGHTAVHLTDAGLFGCHDLAEELTRRRSEPLWDSERAVVLDDGIFDAISGEVRQIAHAFLATPAQEVAVPLAIAPTSFGVDESRGPAVASTATTEQVAFEIVLKHAIPLPAAASHVSDILNPIEQFLGDDSVVPARSELFVDDDPSRVVGVLEHPVKQLERHGSFGDVSASAGRQAEVRHRRLKPLQAIVTGGVQLEGHADQRCAVRVECDRVDLLTFVFDARVDIADLGNAQRAAVERLGPHLLLNVQALQRVHQVVHHIEHALHRHGVRTFAEVLLCADETDAHLVELAFDDGGVEAIAEGARSHVDDDVADLGMIPEVAQKVPEYRPFVDCLG